MQNIVIPAYTGSNGYTVTVVFLPFSLSLSIENLLGCANIHAQAYQAVYLPTTGWNDETENA